MKKANLHTRHLMPAPRCSRLAGFAFLFLILMIPMATFANEQTVAANYPKLFRFGVLNVLPSVNHKDAQVVIEMNFVRQNRKQFPGIEAKLEVLSDVDSAAKMFQQKRLHGISLTAVDYLALKEKASIDPLFISSRRSEPLDAYVLLVKKGVASFDALLKLPRRRLMIENFGEKNIDQVWLDTVLWDHGKKESKVFFTEIRKADKPTRMVLPVFFGQAEACLVPESLYETMVELNPQIGRRLKVFMRSPEFVRSIHCTTSSLNAELVNAIKKNAIRMGDSVDGQQLMMIFQFKRHFPYEPRYMMETERIYRRYIRMKAKVK